MSSNRGVVYMRPGKVEVRDIDDPKLEAPDGRRIEHDLRPNFPPVFGRVMGL